MITKHDLEYVGHESMADYYRINRSTNRAERIINRQRHEVQAKPPTAQRLRGFHIRGILL
jgi:hypothetical protein